MRLHFGCALRMVKSGIPKVHSELKPMNWPHLTQLARLEIASGIVSSSLMRLLAGATSLGPVELE